MVYLSLDEFEDVQASLTLLLSTLNNAEQDDRYWKLAVILTHAALQGACVCLLTRSDGTGALADKTEKALMNKLYGEDDKGRLIDNPDVPWPDEFIASLPELLRRLPKNLAVELPSRKASSYGWDQAGDLRRLHEFRNKFAHFPPTNWGLELIGLPRVLRNSLRLIEKIATSNQYKRWNKFLDNDDISCLISSCTERLDILDDTITERVTVRNPSQA